MTPKREVLTSASERSAKRLDNFRTSLVTYINYLMNELKLSEWEFELMEDAPEDLSHAARTQIRTGSDFARIWISDEFLNDMSDEERSATLIHELLHWHLERPCNFFDAVAEAELGNQASKMAQYAFDAHMELAIDRLSMVIVKFVNHVSFD